MRGRYLFAVIEALFCLLEDIVQPVLGKDAELVYVGDEFALLFCLEVFFS